jgi:hypothetical protein
VRQQRAPGFRQHDPPAGALEQWSLHLFLQAADAFAQRRLGAAELNRSLAKIAEPCDGLEVDKVPNVHDGVDRFLKFNDK